MPELSHCRGIIRLLTGSEPGVTLSVALHDMDKDGKMGLGDVVAMLQSFSGS